MSFVCKLMPSCEVHTHIHTHTHTHTRLINQNIPLVYRPREFASVTFADTDGGRVEAYNDGFGQPGEARPRSGYLDPEGVSSAAPRHRVSYMDPSSQQQY